MNGLYEESPQVRKRRLIREKAAKNPHGVKVGQVYRGWDPRERTKADDQVTRYKVLAVQGHVAVVEGTLAPVSPGAPARTRRSSIRLDRFTERNYKLLSEG